MTQLIPRATPRLAGHVAPSTRRAPWAAARTRGSPFTLTTSVRAPGQLRPSTPMSAAGMSGGGGRGSSAAAAPEPRAPPAAAASQAASEAPAAAAVAPWEAATASAVLDDFAVDQRPIILFDGVCNLCNRGVNFMLDNDPRGAFRLAALQSPAGRRLLARCGRSPDDLSSIVLVEPHRHFIRSEAILRIGAALRVPLPLLAAFGFPVPLPLRDAFYDAIANNRYSFFGRTGACRLRDAGKFVDRFVVE
ncbi:hypothetical protein PLESTB_000396000 [Pleodorina starrii]|uniref:Thiol-disulfide oxidoreductase DCC n=1 Tax=Pleodorina starrii TaxID=330485 RepID=A0A9W6BEI8_9CHLO|nr:hypothetical protein PLESTM_001492000 [Pleodorina starrii]GLC50583.1 hypothetical protein PLESTB_000396000 [Pleodorina starrii]GLC73179.1 hypothetical protein PLESTF_001343900 [Pleodorina starrii]